MPSPTPDARRGIIARATLIALLVALGLWIVAGFLPALIWAVVIAVAIDPLVDRAEARFPTTSRSLIALLFTLAFALIVLVPIGFGIAQGAREAHDIIGWIAQARHDGVPPPAWIAALPFGSSELTNWWRDHFADPVAATAYLDGLNHTLIATNGTLIGKGIAHRSVIFGFTLLALFFLVRDRDAIVAQCRRASEKMLGPTGERIGHQALLSVRGTIDGLVLVGLGVGVVMTVVYFVLGVPHPVLLGVFTALAAMIPFGPVVAFVIAALLLLAQGSVGGAIAVAVIGFGVEFVAGHFVRPLLIGGATKLPFLWVLIGILGGVETLGLLGLFVGPATMAVLVMLWRELVESDATPVA
ncbi:AI-2E family transporter [Sphingomonas panacisoli]|uniref:AI-2E family transporter n=1 Tax=Sphingomonas panacisoli TaxID=1813879 RepID=A0A5B8LF64_9SPHN|nr:AI-2E family transporter [Sphingomonas panacisoli]QDZ06576.1 AI-2E family transporter [Sphingomonas panacisoli]